MSLARPLPLLALALALTLAGCIQAPEELSDEFEPAAAAPPPDAIEGMTAEVVQTDAIVACEGGGILASASACAERVLEVHGRIGIEALPVDLAAPNGQVTLSPSAGDAWSFLATVRVRGLTEEQAREGLDSAWAWSHEGPDGHALVAGPTGVGDGSPIGPVPLGAQVERATYEVTLPSWLFLEVLRIEATNGGFVATGFDLGEVDIETTNGEIVLAGSAKDVRIKTTNGGINLVVAPSASGVFEMETTNGQILLTLPEGRSRGYDLDAATTNGQIEILLQDGHADVQAEPGSNRASFRTKSYESRAIQTTVALSTTNGQIVVAPG